MRTTPSRVNHLYSLDGHLGIGGLGSVRPSFCSLERSVGKRYKLIVDAYTDKEYVDLMDRFKDEGIPLSVGVIDMDW
jgi:hypothetical protein